MKIAIIFDAYPKGGGNFYQSLQSALILKNIKNDEMNFKFVAFDKNVSEKLKKEGIETINFNKSFKTKLYKYLSNSKIFKFMLDFFGFKNPFSNFLKKNDIDLVIFLGPSYYVNLCDGFNFIVSTFDINFKIDNFFPEYLNDKIFKLKDEILKKSCNQAFKIIVDTERSKDELISLYNCLPKKISIQPFTPFLPNLDKTIQKNELENSFHNLNIKNKKFIFYPAQFWAHKNHKYIVEAVSSLKEKKNLNIFVVFCGSDRGNLNYIKNIVDKKKIKQNFYFFEFLNDKEVITLYKNAMALVMPTYVARSSLPLFEAFYFKTPVFYSKNILDEKLEKYVETFDLEKSSELANKLEKFYKNELSLDNKVNDAHNFYLENCNEKKFSDNYIKILEEYKYLQSIWKK